MLTKAMDGVILKSKKEAVVTISESCHWCKKEKTFIRVLVLKGTL
jgi:hypothetical protein